MPLPCLACGSGFGELKFGTTRGHEFVQDVWMKSSEYSSVSGRERVGPVKGKTSEGGEVRGGR